MDSLKKVLSNTVPLYSVVEKFEDKKLEAALQSQNTNVPTATQPTQPTRPAMQGPQTFNNGQEQKAPETSIISKIRNNIVSVVVGLLAAYLSWTCNTAFGTGLVMKVIYSLFAYLFGFLYIIIYFIFLKGKCEIQQSQNVAQV